MNEVTPPRQRLRILPYGLVLAGLLAGGGLWLWLDPPPRDPAAPQGTALPSSRVASSQVSARAGMLRGAMSMHEGRAFVEPPVDAVYTPDGRSLLAITRTGFLSRWDPDTVTPQESIADLPLGVGSSLIRFTANQTYALVLKYPGRRVGFVKPGETGTPHVVEHELYAWTRSASLSRDGGQFLTGFDRPTVAGPDVTPSWHGQTLVLERGPGRKGPPVLRVEEDVKDGVRQLMDADTGARVPVEAVVTLSRIQAQVNAPPVIRPDRVLLTRRDATVDAVALSGDARRAVTAVTRGGKQVVEQWDLAGQSPPQPLTGVEGRVSHAALSPDGSRLVLAWGSRVRFWELPSGKALPLDDRPERSWPVLCLTFSPDGRLVATGSGTIGLNLPNAGGMGSGQVRLWDAQTGRLVRTFDEWPWAVSVGFSPDGTHLVTTGSSLLIWNVATGKVERRFRRG